MNQFLQHQLWVANAAPDYLDKQDIFYPLKDKLLKRYGKRDGWDLQEIQYECWQCDEDGRDWWNDGEECRHCEGTHIYRTAQFYLLRYQLGDRIYHRPMQIWEADQEDLLIGKEQRGTIAGKITHGDSNLCWEDGQKALYWLLLRYEPSTLADLVWDRCRRRWITGWFYHRLKVRQLKMRVNQLVSSEQFDDIPF